VDFYWALPLLWENKHKRNFFQEKKQSYVDAKNVGKIKRGRIKILRMHAQLNPRKNA
jgi:hypothetical protein